MEIPQIPTFNSGRTFKKTLFPSICAVFKQLNDLLKHAKDLKRTTSDPLFRKRKEKKGFKFFLNEFYKDEN